jgi:hypothetical protein
MCKNVGKKIIYVLLVCTCKNAIHACVYCMHVCLYIGQINKRNVLVCRANIHLRTYLSHEIRFRFSSRIADVRLQTDSVGVWETSTGNACVGGGGLRPSTRKPPRTRAAPRTGPIVLCSKKTSPQHCSIADHCNPWPVRR